MSRFSGVVFKCNWFSPVVWEFFIAFSLSYSCISVLSLQHDSFLSVKDRGNLAHSFSAESDRPSYTISNCRNVPLPHIRMSSDIMYAFLCFCLFMFVTKCFFLNWGMISCVRLRNLLELWKCVRASSPGKGTYLESEFFLMLVTNFIRV